MRSIRRTIGLVSGAGSPSRHAARVSRQSRAQIASIPAISPAPFHA